MTSLKVTSAEVKTLDPHYSRTSAEVKTLDPHNSRTSAEVKTLDPHNSGLGGPRKLKFDKFVSLYINKPVYKKK